MKRTYTFLCLCVMLTIGTTKAQNIDFLNNREFGQLNEMNPAYTGVLNQLRILSKLGDDINLGFESRILAGKNYIGLNYKVDELDVLKRKTFKASYVRNVVSQLGVQVKVAAGLNFDSKLFTTTSFTSDFSFNDFNGTRYHVDSANFTDFKDKTKHASATIGAAFLFKNLMFGVSAKQLNNPNISLLKSDIRKSGIEVSGELVGFLPVGTKYKLIPSGVFAIQDTNSFVSAGLGVKLGLFILNGQYELVNENAQYEFGLGARYKRYYINLSYLHQPINLDSGTFRITLNASLLKLKKELGGIRDHIKDIY